MSEEEKTIVRRELARAPIPSSARREVIRLDNVDLKEASLYRK